MATVYVIAIPALMTLFLTSSPCAAWKTDISVKYYSTVILRCHENLTVIPDTSNVFWITPDATLLTETTPTRDFPQNVRFVNGSVVSMLNVTQIDDDMFGYYTCVMVKTNNEVLLARWGLNVNGADFSELEAEYRKNAIVGAVAAAVMIVLLGGACLIWHFRYSKRGRGGERANVEDELNKPSANVFQNRGYEESLSPKEVGDASIKGEDGPVAVAEAQGNGGVENSKM